MIAAGVVAGLGVAGQFASGLMSARARKAQFNEQIRQTKLKMAQTIGTINARASAGGFELGSASTKDYLRATTNEYWREIDSLKKARKRTYQANILGSLAGLAGGAAGAMSAFGRANPLSASSPGTGAFDVSPFATAPGGAYEGWT